MKPYIPPAQYFKQLIDKHGIESSKVVHHGSYHNLDYILDGLTRHFRLMDGMTILDVGAGKFDVLGYLENRVIVGHYRGVEVCKELCDAGVEHYAGADAYCINAALRVEGLHCDFSKYDDPRKFDFVIANGLLSYCKQYGAVENVMERSFIKKMFNLSHIACSFSCETLASTRLAIGDPSQTHIVDLGTLIPAITQLTPKFIIEHHERHGMVLITLFH
jgi:cyclopropane fatty-acyl-phospholipid synthase-like methyltransferase